jgi:hypothetical protein
VIAMPMTTPMVARAPPAPAPSDVGELGGQAALDEDDGQRGRAHVSGQLDVVELDADRVLPEKDADQQEEQQAGKPDPGRHPGADNAGQQLKPPISNARYSCSKLISFPFRWSGGRSVRSARPPASRVLPVNQEEARSRGSACAGGGDSERRRMGQDG